MGAMTQQAPLADTQVNWEATTGQPTGQVTDYTFDATIMEAIAKDYADEYARQRRMDVQDMMADIRRVNRAMYWDKQLVVPLASVTDVLPDSLQHDADRVNDWLVLARNYTTALRRELTTDRTTNPATETVLPDVLRNIFPVLDSVVNVYREAKQVLADLSRDDTIRNKDVSSMVQDLNRDGGLAGLSTSVVSVLSYVVTVLGRIGFGAGKSPSEVERLLAQRRVGSNFYQRHYGEDTRYRSLMLPDYIDLGVVYNDLMSFVFDVTHRDYYPGAWDGCDSKNMHEIIYRWVSNARYVGGYGESYHYLYLAAALAKRRPHIYALVLEVSRWLEDNYARVRPKGTPHKLPQDDFLLPEAEDMAALLACPGDRYKSNLMSVIGKKAYLSEPSGRYNIRLVTSMPEAVVKDDGTVMIEHYARPRDMVKGRRTTTTPGRFVKKILDNAGDNIVKSIAEHIIALYRPLEVEFISDLDPSGWSEAYMNARGFTSCMTPDDECDRPYSAVQAYAARAFATEDNRDNMYEVALAVLRSPDTGQVVARSIVNKDTKRYVRVYGDDRLGPALQELGYKHDKYALAGCHLYLQPVDLDERHPQREQVFLCPYLDGHLGFVFDPDDTGTWDLSASGIGILVTMIAPDDAIGLIESDYKYVYRANDTSGTTATYHSAKVYEFEEDAYGFEE